MSEKISRSIFRAYDIRGVVGETLNCETMTLIGKAIGSYALAQGETKIVLGRDGRLSGPKLSKALMSGLRQVGVDVIDVGRVPTPVLYFATYSLGVPSGVMVTGSHNPANYNGIKIVIKGKALTGDEVQKLYELIEKNEFVSGEGYVTRHEISKEYIKAVTERVKLNKPLKIVVDAGNGVAGAIAPTLLQELGCEVYPLYCDVDGTFPNHHPDPSQEKNLQDLIQVVCQQNADLGLAFDGDGDRLGVVTRQGKVIYPDRQLILFAKAILKDNPGAKIIYDVKSTRHIATEVEAAGGVPIMCRTGHSFVKAKMREEEALLGGEMSGHVFFKERWFGFDDALYSAARLLEILAAATETPEEVFQAIPDSVSTPELKISVLDEEKFKVMDKLVAAADFEGGTINSLDGLRVDFEKGWGLVRPSNTTPCLVARFEADSEEELHRVQCLFRQCLGSVAPHLDLPF